MCHVKNMRVARVLLLLLLGISCVLAHKRTPAVRTVRRIRTLHMKASIPVLSPDSVAGGIKNTFSSINIAPITKLVTRSLAHSLTFS